jgi:hypothetical protein
MSGIAIALTAVHGLVGRMPPHRVGDVSMVILAIPCHVTMASETPTRRYAREAFRLKKGLEGVMLEEDEGLRGR